MVLSSGVWILVASNSSHPWLIVEKEGQRGLLPTGSGGFLLPTRQLAACCLLAFLSDSSWGQLPKMSCPPPFISFLLGLNEYEVKSVDTATIQHRTAQNGKAWLSTLILANGQDSTFHFMNSSNSPSRSMALVPICTSSSRCQCLHLCQGQVSRLEGKSNLRLGLFSNL